MQSHTLTYQYWFSAHTSVTADSVCVSHPWWWYRLNLIPPCPCTFPGFDDPDIQAYYTYMVDMAVMLGAPKDRAETELKESLLFEIALANVSVMRRRGRGRGREAQNPTGATSTHLGTRPRPGRQRWRGLYTAAGLCWLIQMHTACKTRVAARFRIAAESRAERPF